MLESHIHTSFTVSTTYIILDNIYTQQVTLEIQTINLSLAIIFSISILATICTHMYLNCDHATTLNSIVLKRAIFSIYYNLYIYVIYF